MNVRYAGFVPYLFFDDVAAAMEWYTRVFGFEEIGRWMGEDGAIQNGEMRVGDAELWLDGGGRHMFGREEGAAWIGVWVDDVDEMYRQVRAAGVDAEAPVNREFGVRELTVKDPAGYTWGFMRRL